MRISFGRAQSHARKDKRIRICLLSSHVCVRGGEGVWRERDENDELGPHERDSEPYM